MSSNSSQPLLMTVDPPPVAVINPYGASPFLLVGDHAGNAMPQGMGSLGLSHADLTRHIAWDIGTAGLGDRLAQRLDAVFIRQTYSRLVVDCNRDAAAADAMPAVSDGTVIPANRELTPTDRQQRVDAIHRPYQQAIADELASRDGAGRTTILVSLHSFTPVMNGTARPWQIGVLHAGGDPTFALALLRLLELDGDLVVGDNQPYVMDDTDHTVPRHAFAARRPYVEIEIRQDLLMTAEAQAGWCERLATVLGRAADSPS